MLRSDAYEITPDFKIALAAGKAKAPIVDIDGKAYKLVPQLEAATPSGPPSLIKCDRLKITGKVVFEADVVLEGSVVIEGSKPDEEAKVVKTGTYKDATL